MHSWNRVPWERCSGRTNDRIRQECYISVHSKTVVSYGLGRTVNAASKTTVAVVSPLDYIRKQQVTSIEKMDCGICAAAIEESIQGGSEIESGKLDIVFGSSEQWLSD